jgi:hypothetical protein
VRAWYFLSRYFHLTTSIGNTSGCSLIWNFFATGHGKGEVDGAGALLKKEIFKKHIKLKGNKIQNVAEVVAFLKFEVNKYHVAHPNAQQHINKFFYEVKIGDIDRNKSFEYETMKGSRAKH